MPLDRPANINAEDTVATLSSTRLTLAMSRSSVAFNGQDIIAAIQSDAPALPDGSVRQWFIRLYLTGDAKEQFPEGYYDVALWRITSPSSWNDKQTGASTALAAIRAIIRSMPSGGGGGGQVDTIVPGDAIDVDATDPVNPIVGVRVDGVTIGINGSNQLEVPAGGGGYVPVSRTISTTPPLTGGGNLSANRTISIPQANGSTNGYLSSGDWTTFNGKVSGPGSAGADNIPIFDGTTGKVIKDSGLRLDQLLEESGFGDVGIIESATGNVPFILKDVKDGDATSVQSNTGSFQTNVRTQNSIVLDTGTNRINLSGDASAPGNSKYYGTDGSGTKGFHDLPGDTGITQLTGDVTAGPGSGSQAATLANTAVTPGSYGSATQSVVLSVDSKGRLTAASQNTITPAVGSITGLGTGVGTALAQNANSASGFVTQSSGDGRYILRSLGTAKGDLAGFSASATPERVPVGTDGQYLRADSTATAGVAYAWNPKSAWAAPPLSTAGGSTYGWPNQPSALTFFLGAARWVLPVNLSGATQARISILTNNGGTYVANSKLRFLYRTAAAGWSSTIGDYSQLGDSAHVEVAFAIGVAFFQSSWIDIAAGAKTDVIIALAGIDGNGTADPQFLSVAFEYR